jgi:hypothetical protein
VTTTIFIPISRAEHLQKLFHALERLCCVGRSSPAPGDCRGGHLGSALSSPPAGYRFPRGVIAVAVRWYLRYGLSYRDVEELLAERGIEVDHVTVYRWVQTFTPESSTQPSRPATSGAIGGLSMKAM